MRNARMKGSYIGTDSSDASGIYKVCTFCGKRKPIGAFAKNGQYGYRADCKVCYNIRRRENATKKKHTAFVCGMKRRGESKVSYTHQQWKETVIFFNGECAYCGCTTRKGERLTRDHLIPVSKGGLTEQDNIVPACARCNSSKNKDDWREWFMRQPFFSQERMNRIFRWRSIIRAAGGGEKNED